MKRVYLLTLLLTFLLPIAVSAETVMLYTETSVGKGAVDKSRGYMEDGIMGTFFDAGHIIFNSHASEDSNPKADPFDDRHAFRIAKAGGAGVLLEIIMRFSEDEEELLPRSVEYRVYRLKEETLLGKGTVRLKNAGDAEELSDEELLQNMGRSLAEGALSRL